MSFLSYSRLFQVVLGCYLLIVGCFKSFLAHCRSFHCVSCCRLFQVVSGLL